MPFGKSPYTRDYLDAIIDRRLGPRPDTMLRRDALSPYEAPNYPVGQASMSPEPPSFLSRLVNRLRSDEGMAAISGGLAPQSGGGNFFSGLTTSLGRSAGAVGTVRRSNKALTTAASDKERQFGLDERRVKADELRASRETAGHRTRAEDLSGEYKFLADTLGWSPDQIDKYYQTRGIGGGGARAAGAGSWKDRLALSYLGSGRAKNIDEARMLSENAGRSAQPVGSITKSVMDPNTYNMTTVRVGVSRIQNPLTGEFNLIDMEGNDVTPQDLQTFQQNPGGFTGGTGGAVNSPPPPPPPPGSGIAPVPSHAPTGAAPPPAVIGPAPSTTPNSDFIPGTQGATEDQVIQLLMSPGVTPETIRLFAAGRGPMGNSTRIKQAAAQLLGMQ